MVKVSSNFVWNDRYATVLNINEYLTISKDKFKKAEKVIYFYLFYIINLASIKNRVF